MSLADRLGNSPQRQSGKPCSVQVLLDRLEGDELKALNAMLYELGWSQARIYHEVTAEGHTIAQQTINRHRSRGCRCYL